MTTTTPSAARERVAWIIDPQAFKNWDDLYRCGLNAGDGDDDATRSADIGFKPGMRVRRVKIKWQVVK